MTQNAVMTELPAVAKKVFTHCKKCETDRYQVVVTHTNSKTAKLECEVCKTKNSFKLQSTKSRTAVPRKTSASKLIASNLAKWSELREKISQSPSPYNMRATFTLGTALEHPKFGLGFVIGVTGQAVQVVFEDAERSLVHSRG